MVACEYCGHLTRFPYEIHFISDPYTFVASIEVCGNACTWHKYAICLPLFTGFPFRKSLFTASSATAQFVNTKLWIYMLKQYFQTNICPEWVWLETGREWKWLDWHIFEKCAGSLMLLNADALSASYLAANWLVYIPFQFISLLQMYFIYWFNFFSIHISKAIKAILLVV